MSVTRRPNAIIRFKRSSTGQPEWFYFRHRSFNTWVYWSGNLAELINFIYSMERSR